MDGIWHFEKQTPPEKVDKQQLIISKVKVEMLFAESISDTVELYGPTEPNRVTTLKSEITVQIIEVFAKRGSLIKQGQTIAQIEVNDLKLQLTRSKA